MRICTSHLHLIWSSKRYISFKTDENEFQEKERERENRKKDENNINNRN
jgi:hypothetical protein